MGAGELSAIFNWDCRDEIYNNRLSHVTVLGFSCNKVDEFCFCTSVGGNPGNTEGSDILFTRAGENGDFLAEIITEKGLQLVSIASDLFEKDGDIDKSKFLAEVPVRFDREKIKQKLEKLFENDKWVDLSLKCLGCGACAYVCPTCACFDIQDEAHGRSGSRVRCWDSCGYSGKRAAIALRSTPARKSTKTDSTIGCQSTMVGPSGFFVLRPSSFVMTTGYVAFSPSSHELQRHGRLALETHLLVQPEQRGDAVEQPSGAGGDGRIDAVCQHLAQQLALGDANARTAARSSISSAARRTSPTAGRGPRGGLVHRRVAARQAEGAQMGHAVEAGRVAEQELAAPDRAVRAVAGAIPGHAQRRPVRRSRPGRRPGGRGGAGRRPGRMANDEDACFVIRRSSFVGCRLPRPVAREIVRMQIVRDRRPAWPRTAAGNRR